MKLKSIYIAVFTLLLISCNQNVERVFITFHNEIDIDRTEVVVLSKNQIVEKIPSFDESQILSFVDSLGNLIPYQLDDLDQDGSWDEVALALDIKGLEEKKILISAFAKAEQQEFTKFTDVHFGIGKIKPEATEVQKQVRIAGEDWREMDSVFYQMEGPAWENEKVGFRMYFDPRNGIDIFGKTTDQPVLYKQGLNSDYHKKADWGMDILKVGNSLGAGSIAFMYQDSLYRLTGRNGARFESITEGPARAIFRMTYLDEPIGDKTYHVVHTITIEKGDWFYKSDIELHGITDGIELVTGIVDLKENKSELIDTWQHHKILSSYGKQSENNDHLGMAIITNNTSASTSEAPIEGNGIIKTHLLNLGEGKNHQFYFMSGWEASDSRFNHPKSFRITVNKEVTKIFSPITIK